MVFLLSYLGEKFTVFDTRKLILHKYIKLWKLSQLLKQLFWEFYIMIVDNMFIYSLMFLRSMKMLRVN